MAQNSQTSIETAPFDGLDDAVKLAKAGKKTEACARLREVVAGQPANQPAWLWLSALTPERYEAEAALARASAINPFHQALPRAQAWLAKRFAAPSPTPEVSGSLPSASKPGPALPQIASRVYRKLNAMALWFVVTAVVIGLLLLLLGMAMEVQATVAVSGGNDRFGLNEAAQAQVQQLKEAWAQQDWTRAVTILEELYRQEPDSPLVKDRLAHAYLQDGVALRHRGIVGEAMFQFEAALVVNPEDLRAQQEAALASNYLAGGRYYQRGQWQEAIGALETIYALEPHYTNVQDMLYSAYFNQALALQAVDDLPAAREAFEAAINLRPDLEEPRLRLAELEFAMAPDTPPAFPVPSVPLKDRIVVVGIAEQRMHIYEGDKKVYDFIISTGEPGNDTAVGEFEILNKIDLAYASTWNLDMPYWLGIYWSGPLQNGIHSLPTVRDTGQTLWDGYLGQRVSYGCVILSDDDAKILYDWAEVGAKVKIVPSLANWIHES